MHTPAVDVEDFVVDVVLDVAAPAAAVEQLNRHVRRFAGWSSLSSARSAIWLTVVVPATSQHDAVREVRDHLQAWLSDLRCPVTDVQIRCAALSEVYAWLDPARDDPELETLDVTDLLAETMWREQWGEAATRWTFSPGSKLIAASA